MKGFAYTLVASLGAAATAQADVPVYRERTLTLQEALVIEDSGPGYYRNVKLAAGLDGRFTVVAAESRNLALVHEVTLLMAAGLPGTIAVEVRGDMTRSCLALEAPLVSRQGRSFTVAVAETPYDPAIQCFSPHTDFVLNIPLDLQGLEAGEYTVAVNGVEKGFTLAPD